MLHGTLWHCAKCSATAFESLSEVDQVDSDKVNRSLARVTDVDQNFCTQLGCSAGEKKMPLAPPLTRTVACRACGFTLTPKGQALDCCGHCGLSFVTPMKPADFTKLVSDEKAKAAKEEAYVSHNQKLMIHWVRTHGGPAPAFGNRSTWDQIQKRLMEIASKPAELNSKICLSPPLE